MITLKWDGIFIDIYLFNEAINLPVSVYPCTINCEIHLRHKLFISQERSQEYERTYIHALSMRLIPHVH